MDASSLCTPALVYLVIAIISVLFVIGKLSAWSVIVKAFFILLWTWFLNFLCSKGHSGIAWFLVLIPYIIMALIFLFALDIFAHAAANGQKPAVMQAPMRVPVQVPVKVATKEGFYYQDDEEKEGFYY